MPAAAKGSAFTHLGADNSASACGDLHARNLRNLVGLDVGAELYAAVLDVRLPFADIPLQAIQINQRYGRIQIVDRRS